MRKILSLIFILICFSGLSQVVTYPKNLPTVKSDSGWYKIGYVQPTVYGVVTAGDTAIRPNINGAMRFWQHAGVDTALWAWSNTRWIKISSTATAGSVFWGQILGNIYNQTDLINYIDSVFSAGIGTDTLNLSYRIDTIGRKVIEVIHPLVAVDRTRDTTTLYFDSTYFNQFLTGVDTLNLSYRIDSIRAGSSCPTAFQNGYAPIVSWIDSLKFSVTGGAYNINCIGLIYNTPDSVTLAAADPTLNRIDVIYVDANGNVGVLTGTAATTPSAPQVDPLTQIALTEVYVPAASLVPQGVTLSTIYDENLGTPTEFATAAGAGWTVNFGDVALPYHLTKDIDAGVWSTTKSMTFTGASLLSTAQSLVKFYISLKAAMPTGSIQLRLLNAGVPVSSSVALSPTYGFNPSLAYYQQVAVPFADLIPTNAFFDGIEITVTGSGSGFYLDWMTLQGGISNGNKTYVTNVFRKAGTDSVFQVINGVNIYAFKDSSGGGGGGGTVTSVALAAPSIYTVSGSPVTTSGTLTFAPNNAQGDLIYGSATNTLSYLNKSTTANSFLKNSGASNNPAWAVITASDIGSGAALTKTDDTNVTLSLGGSPSTALLAATSMTLGWTGVLGVSRGGTSYGSYTTGDMLYASGSGTLSKLSIGTTGQKLVVVGGVPVWRDTAVTASFTPAAMTKVDDTNVTLTLGGTPATSLLQATSLTLGWTGLLGLSRGGTNANLSATGGSGQYLKQSSTGAAVTVGTIPASDIASGAALTKTDDTNVTLTLGGSPTTSLLAATSLTLGWTGTLGPTRGGTGIGTYTTGDILYASATNVLSKLAIGTTGQKLVVVGGLPVWRDTAAIVGSAGWSTTGNAGLTAGTNFIGTTDAIAFVTKTNNIERARVLSTGEYGIGTATPIAPLHVVGGDQLPTFGAELLSNSNWTSTNWTGSWSTGWTHTTGNTTSLTNTLAAVTGTGYRIAYTVTGRTAGNVFITFGGVSNTNAISATGEWGMVAISTGTLTIAPSSTFDGTIFLTIKSVTGNSTPLVSFANTTDGSIDFRSDTASNTAAGKNALARVISNSAGASTSGDGIGNTAFGNGVLALNISGAGNTGVGAGSLAANNSGYQNTAYGGNSLSANTSGSRNTAIGQNSMASASATAVGATAVGWQAGSNATTNSSYGGQLSGTNNTGTTNSVWGADAGSKATSFAANNEVAMGYRSAYRLHGVGNTAIGTQALGNNGTVTGTGTYNSGLGFQAANSTGTINSGSYNITLGAWVEQPSWTASGQLNIGNVLYGTNLYQTASMSSAATTLGSIGIGLTTPTARLMLPAGTTTASTAPLKFTSGTNMTSAESGAMEYDGTNLFFSPSTTRMVIPTGLVGSATLDFASTGAGAVADLTVTVTGAADGDPVYIGIPNASQTATASWYGWVSATNTVTIRYSPKATEDPASGVFKVFVKKN